MKKCKECLEFKAITDYPKDKRHPLGHSGRTCQACRNKNKRSLSYPIVEHDKECSECTTVKPYTEFNRDTKSQDGLSGKCKYCVNTKKREDNQKNQDRISTVRKNYRDNNPEKIKEHRKQHYKNRREHIIDRVKKYTIANKEIKHEYAKRHYLENSHIYKFHARKRTTQLGEGINCMFLDELKSIYQKAQDLSKKTDVQYQVDHIIPLTHNDICGLHVPWNIQILTESENRSKKNKFDGTYSNESWKEMTSYGI